MEFILIFVGFSLLIKGADMMVQAASKLARSFGVPTMIIGLTVIALGTSMPEAAIGVLSAINKANQLTLGDVIGSSVANITLIIGFSAVLRPLIIEPKTISRNIPISIIVQLVFVIFLLTGEGINRLESITLIIGLIGFLVYQIQSGKSENKQSMTSFEESDSVKKFGIAMRWRFFLITLIGMAGVVIGAKLIVENAILIATGFGLSETMIGITIVAFGTSLPELVVSLVSVSHKEHDLLIGNIIGSNILNILFVVGVSGTIYPIASSNTIWINLALMMTVSILFLLMAKKNSQISRLEGSFLLIIYMSFLILAVLTT